MKCEEFDNRLHRLLDERRAIDSDTELLKHGDDCRRCQGVLDAFRDLWAGLDAFEPPPLPDGFAESIVSQAVGEPVDRPKRRSNRLVVGMAVAASLLIMATFVSRSRWIRDVPDEDAGQQVASDSPPADAPRLIRDNETRHIKCNEAAKVREQSQAWPVNKPLASIAAGEIPLDWDDIVSNEKMNAVDEIRGSIKPITSSLSTAFRAIRSTIPWGRVDSSETSRENSVDALPNSPRVYTA